MALSLAGWLVRAGVPPDTPDTIRPSLGETQPQVDPQAAVNMAPTSAIQPSAAPEPAPVGIAFGGRADVADGWQIAVTRPYLCTVLMAVPTLQKAGTRIVRVTITLVNGTGSAQPASAWSLAAAARGGPAELVLWPQEGFRGVPDVQLAPGRSVRFLIAIRIPDQPTQVEISANRGTATRAVLAGTL